MSNKTIERLKHEIQARVKKRILDLTSLLWLKKDKSRQSRPEQKLLFLLKYSQGFLFSYSSSREK